VTDLELMKAAVKFNDFKLPVEELGTMLAFAQQKAKDTGQSIDYMTESLVTGLGRKSLMILDNLGLSATEIKEKMKETGDMTKAVGAIIREQMSKAGDYVETAADRAAQADVKLKNAMEELGRTFQPLSDAGSSMWNSLKVGALDLLNNAVRPLIDALTEAGRIRSQYAKQGGDERVNRQLDRLKNIGSKEYRQGTYKAQKANYDSKIGSYQQYLDDYKKWQSDNTAVGAYDRMQSFQKQTGLSLYSDVKEQLEVFKRMRSEYVQGAKIILNDNPSPSPADITTTKPTKTPKGGGGGGSTTEPTYAADSIAAQQKLVADLTRQWNEAGADVRNQYVVPLVEAEAKLKTMRDQQALMKEQAQGKLMGNTSDGKGIEVPISSNVSFEEWMNSVKEQLANLKIDPIEIPIETTKKDVMAIAKSASITADVVGSIGDAFNAIEDPAAKVAGTVAQSIATVAMGYAQATLAAAQTGNPWVWAAFAASGLATMITMISQIHSSTGYAQGGMIKGNSYSGDNIGGLVDGSQFVGLNAGEIVLNASQQNMLAQNLQGGGGTVNVVGRVVGEDIFLSADRYARRSGRGGILTGKNL
jgi:hypothetical protein